MRLTSETLTTHCVGLSRCNTFRDKLLRGGGYCGAEQSGTRASRFLQRVAYSLANFPVPMILELPFKVRLLRLKDDVLREGRLLVPTQARYGLKSVQPEV